MLIPLSRNISMTLPVNKLFFALASNSTQVNNQSASFSSIDLGSISSKISKSSADLNEKLTNEAKTDNSTKKLSKTDQENIVTKSEQNLLRALKMAILMTMIQER